MFTRVLRSTAKLIRHHTQHVSGIRQFSSNSKVLPKTAQCRHFYRTGKRLQPPSSQKDKLRVELLLLESKLKNVNLKNGLLQFEMDYIWSIPLLLATATGGIVVSIIRD